MPFLLKEKISCLSTDLREADQALCIVAYSDWHSSVGPEGNDYIYYDKYQIWLPPAISLTARKLVVSFPQKCENARERNPPCI